jgi:hypothetical protein
VLFNKVDALTASKIVWLDCLLTNVDRTARNTNMLVWNKQLWLIDHGASLYFHHSWDNWEEQSTKPFAPISSHVLLPYASQLDVVDAEFKSMLTPDIIHNIVNLIPDDWLAAAPQEATIEAQRAVYAQFLINRVQHSSIFLNQANHARATLI